MTTQTVLITGALTGIGRAAAYAALSDAERKSVHEQGVAAWGAWVVKHQDAISKLGGPLGKTKRVSDRGIEDASNQLALHAHTCEKIGNPRK